MYMLISSWCLLLSGGFLALILSPRPRLSALVGSCSAVAGSMIGLMAAIPVLFSGAPLSLSLPLPFLPGASFSLLVDGLAAFFLVPIFLIGLLGAIYGHEYMAGSRHRLPGLHWLFYNGLVLSMSLVVTASHALLFLFAWECMSLFSFFLIIGEHEEQTVTRAGWIYLLATHLGAALLFIFFLAAGTLSASFDFSAFTALRQVSPLFASGLFLLLLVGFGSKAGLFPLHVWLPAAHPAAPSHVSALMSGVMVKCGIYGILRLLSFLPPPPAWWGGLMLTLGITGAVFGIAMAASQKDLKRSLAYSTIENVGLIFLALGFWLYCRSHNNETAAALALLGGLLHIWNHALFKSLLFMGAGSLLHGTGTRNLNRMGGLLRRMPGTGILLIAGSMAITALPPFNGLIGEWFLYRSLLEAGARLTGFAAFVPLVLLGLLALVGGMVLMVFTRTVGIALSGEPRTPEAAEARESGWRMVGPMAALGGLCLLGGLFPALLLGPVSRVAELIAPGLPSLVTRAGLMPLWLGWLGWGLAGFIILAVAMARWLASSRGQAPTASTWGCGYILPSSRMSYSAEGFAELAGTSFFCPGLQPEVDVDHSPALFPGPLVFRQQAPDLVLEDCYQPLFKGMAASCLRMRKLQSGPVHFYLFYIFSTTVLLLAWVAFRYS